MELLKDLCFYLILYFHFSGDCLTLQEQLAAELRRSKSNKNAFFVVFKVSLCRASLLIVAFFHGSVFPQVVKCLQLSSHKLPSSDQSLDLLLVLHRFVFWKCRAQTVSEVVAAFGVLSSEVEELWAKSGNSITNKKISSNKLVLDSFLLFYFTTFQS